MDAYEEKIFDYLTKEDNFEYAYEIYQQFPKVEKKLIKEFWDLVKMKLEEKVKDSDWEIGFSEDVFNTYSKLGLKLVSYDQPDIHIIYQELHRQPYYGIWLNTKSEILNKSSIRDYAGTVETIKNFEDKGNNWWLGYNYTELDFTNIESLKRIRTNAQREALAVELANILFELAEEVKDDFIQMSEMTIPNPE